MTQHMYSPQLWIDTPFRSSAFLNLGLGVLVACRLPFDHLAKGATALLMAFASLACTVLGVRILELLTRMAGACVAC